MALLSKRETRKLASIVAALLSLLVAWYLQTHPQTFSSFQEVAPAGTYKVTGFSDGDTIQVDMNGKEETIRFIGVDTPETHDPRKAVQCFGKAAASYTKNLIGNSLVRLEADPLSTNRDRYNRLLRYVYILDGRLVQAEIIKNGYGFAYTSFPFTKSVEFKQYETEARTNERGLWKDCNPTENQYGGYTSDNQ